MKQFKNKVNNWKQTTMLLTVLTVIITLLGCSSSNNDDSKPFELTSSAFQDGGRIDIKHTNANKNISIPLAWNKAPNGTKSFAIFMVDLHPIASNWAHWIVIDIPAKERGLAEGISRSDELPKGSRELYNSFGSKGYGGPQPPSGSGDHDYKTILYALNVKALDVPSERITFDNFQNYIEPYVIESTEISGFYENK